MNSKSRSWCFTHFDNINNKLNNIIECKYLILGKEICPNTKKEHIQGFVYFTNPISFRGCQKRLSNYCIHVEIMKGSLDQAIDYCKKEGNFVEEGEKPEIKNGRRNDYVRMLELVNSGMPM